ncbi:bile acid Fe-S flavoenzyme BaiCD [Alkaliphilus oremlandii]|uniref:NADH:flavin oxidoreductase/NADH oxidase n=1 Tax=Alkaliphilus oremlandii (strain OhILAs) TaxID=350688 RepID=A8MJ68_ALKOO|nr:NAD(P)/FAD-dependent oxidoreductase [Alkaliphilus oremlandii]ABW19850.1 NADH:flavin oxidoreductase/NADH oxidase [Alkaliphilus oremlandii OhILAs]
MIFHNVFSPIQIRGMKLKNRVVFPAMGTKMPGNDRYVTQQLIDYHVARAFGGNGLNFTEVCGVYGPSTPKSFLGIYDDQYIPGLKNLTDAIHEAGGKAGVQLWQGGFAVASYQKEGIILPSDRQINSTDEVIPGASKETINEVIKAFGAAAKRAVEAGFDCIEFHAGHNYMPHAFLSPAFNKRTDEYGGSLENRARFSIECIKEIRNNIPEDMPLFMRVVAQDDYLENGLTIEDIIEFCKLAKVAGVDVLNVSRGNFSSAAIKYEVPPVDLPKGFNVANAERIKRETGMITIAVGRINDPAQADEIIGSGKADMVVIGRGQLADPEFCNKALAGNVEDIIKCVGCNQGCYDGFVSPDVPHITCLRNPALCRESEYALVKTTLPKKILIAGGGVAGLEAAITLKQRGHHPILCEAGNSLGGQFALAGAAPRKEELKDAAIAMGEMAKREGVEIRFSTPVTTDVMKEIKPEEVIIAIGADPIKPNIPGGNLPHVTNSHDILAGNTTAFGNVVIIGGGLVGLEVAEHLSEKSDRITVVEMLEQVAKDLGQLRKICVMESLHHAGINTVTGAKCVEIREDVVVIEKDGNLQEIPCNSVVIAIGARSRNSDDLKAYCDENKIPHYTIGDALRARRALNGTAEAGEVARKI